MRKGFPARFGATRFASRRFRSILPRLLDDSTRANRPQGRGAKPRAPLGQPSYRRSSYRVTRHRGALVGTLFSLGPEDVVARRLASPSTRPAPPSPAGRGSDLPAGGRVPQRTPSRTMSRSEHHLTPLSHPEADPAGRASVGSHGPAARRSPLHGSEARGGDAATHRYRHPWEGLKGPTGVARAARGGAPTVRRRACGDGPDRRWKEETGRTWVRGDRSPSCFAGNPSSQGLAVAGAVSTA
jgi:hypothetical protein